MKRLILPVLMTATLLVYAPIVTAQLPRLQVYFDASFTETYANCPDSPPGTEIQELYFVAHNFNAWLSAIEFRVLYPPQMMFLGDNLDDGQGGLKLMLGTSPEGIAVAWTVPANGFEPLFVSRATVLWMCQGCAEVNHRVCFDVYPTSGKLRAVRWPDESIIYGFGQAGMICPTCCPTGPVICPDYTIPVQPTTWGAVKALYTE
jgi:hypothetical protein